MHGVIDLLALWPCPGISLLANATGFRTEIGRPWPDRRPPEILVSADSCRCPDRLFAGTARRCLAICPDLLEPPNRRSRLPRKRHSARLYGFQAPQCPSRALRNF